MADEKTQSLLDKLEGLKDELAADFESTGLGKDAYLKIHDAIDFAKAQVAAVATAAGHDLNADLAESPEDHPLPQGQEPAPINTDPDPANVAPVAEPEPVVSGAPVEPAPVVPVAEPPAPEAS